MRLYLVRHGEAVREIENPERPLSEKGRSDLDKLAVFLARSGARIERILHSPKRRALETAALLGAVIGQGVALEQVARGLSPNDPVDILLEAVKNWSVDTMMVGHLPHIGRLASRLMVSDSQHLAIDFAPATVACLERNAEDGPWRLIWVICPEVIGLK